MDEGLPSVSIFLFFAILIIDIVLYGFDVAIDRIREDDVEKRALEGKDKTSHRLLKIIDKPGRHFETMHVMSIITNVLLGVLVYAGISRYADRLLQLETSGVMVVFAHVVVGILLIFLIMCFGIVIPRRLAFRNPEKWAYVCFYPASVIRAVLLPFLVIVDGFTGGILYIFGIRGDDNLADVTEEEIKSMVNEGQEQGVLQETEADMITNIFEFSDKEAQDIMTNRNAMVAIDANMTLKQAVSFMMDTNNSRFPVYLDDIDHIIGIMHIRDAMKKLSEETDSELPIRKIKGLLRQPKFVPETRNIDSLFHNMQTSKTQMVIVIDEYGQTAGLVSMEDILEEIVGNILDEYDEDEDYIKPTRNQGEFIVDGMTPIEVLEKKFEFSFGETEFETLNGFLISKLDRIPEEDEEFSVNVEGYNFQIQSVQNHMIQSVLMTKLPVVAEETEDQELEIANK